VADNEAPPKHCSICAQNKPGSLQFFYGNAGNPGGLSKYCKDCSDAAKKRYKLKYNKRSQSNIGVRAEPPKPKVADNLPDRVQYALLTGKCPRCGGVLQRYRDDYEDAAPCMICLTCSREVWLPSKKEERAFLCSPPPAIPMPYWVAQRRGVKRKRKRKTTLSRLGGKR
jgi:hypothetical protein